MDVIAYIGDLQDVTFRWEGGNWNGNIPKRLSPNIWFAHDVRLTMLSLIKEGKLIGKQTDWGSYVAKVTKKDIENVLSVVEVRNEDNIPLFHENPLDNVKKYLLDLNSDTEYALVTAELC